MTKKIDKIMSVLLEPSSNYFELEMAIKLLKEFYFSLIDESSMLSLENVKETKTTYGIALDPINAISCLDDIKRTTKYMQGINSAISLLKGRQTKRDIHIVYAGCGPLAPLVLPLIMFIETEGIQFTLIDIHQESIDVLSEIISQLKLSTENIELLSADATTVKVNGKLPVDLIVIEAMTAALKKEDQVSISCNLVDQLDEDGILIPQEIKINAVLTDPKKEFLQGAIKDKGRVKLGKIFALNKSSIQLRNKRKTDYFPVESIQLPMTFDADYQIMLTTEIKVYNDIEIAEYESGLTNPMLYPIGNDFKENRILQFSYKMTGMPEFEYISIET